MGEAGRTSETSLIPLAKAERQSMASGMETYNPPTEVQTDI